MDKPSKLSIKLVIKIEKNESDILKSIFNHCQYLESILIWYVRGYTSEKKMLKIAAKYSSKYFYRLYICNFVSSRLLPEELESFFLSWGKRIPQKALILFITQYSELNTIENIKIIKKYKLLGIIKEFNEFNTEYYDTERYLWEI